MFRDILNRVFHNRSNEATLPHSERPLIHPEFPVSLGRWSWNTIPKTLMRESYPFKVRFTFDEQQRELLSACPCRGKIGRADTDGSYLGYLYPDSKTDEEKAVSWAKRFGRVDICLLGEWRNGGWIPGTVVRTVADGSSNTVPKVLATSATKATNI